MNKFLVIFCVTAALPFAAPGYLSGQHHHQHDSGLGNYNNYHSGYPIQTIDLGTFVGKHQLKPNTIKLIRTVQVKIPVPYRVNVPHPLPYPVPVHRPYPVEVPKYIKVKEQVPVYVPVHDGGHIGGESGYSNYAQQEYKHANGAHGSHDEHGAATTASAYQHQGLGHYQQPKYDQGRIDYGQYHQPPNQPSYEGSASASGDYPQYDERNGANVYPQDQYSNSYKQQHVNDENFAGYAYQQQHYPGHYEDDNQHQPDSEHHENGEQTSHSGKELIYAHPIQGIAAFAVHDGHGNKGYHLEQAHETESDDGSSHSSVYKSEQKLSGSQQSGGKPDGEGDYYSKNYKKQVHEVREVHEEESDSSSDQQQYRH